MGSIAEIKGERFGRLVAVKRSHRKGNGCWIWECLCDCGQTSYVRVADLRAGHTKSCGCLQLETITKHGHTKRGKRTLTYTSWAKMMARCYNKNCVEYKWYGAAGKTVCERWHTYENFLADMGERSCASMTIDRYPSTAIVYNKKNCRWASKAAQARNQSGQMNSTSKYKGVRWSKVLGRWTAQIHCNKKQFYLGNFVNEVDAAKAYDTKAKEMWGADAYINMENL